VDGKWKCDENYESFIILGDIKGSFITNTVDITNRNVANTEGI